MQDNDVRWMDAYVVESSRDLSEGIIGEIKKPSAQLQDNWQPNREFSHVSPWIQV
jgi:hypothetical protein